jgi:hypothetical protein
VGSLGQFLIRRTKRSKFFESSLQQQTCENARNQKYSLCLNLTTRYA